MRYFFLCLLVMSLSACAGKETLSVADETAPLRFERAEYLSLPGWQADTHGPALMALRLSCTKILQVADDSRLFGPGEAWGRYGEWKAVCRRLPPGDDSARAFIEQNFTPWRARTAATGKGLFTGYYEASLYGSRTRAGPYQTPLYRRPSDLVTVDLGAFRDALKGQRIAGYVADGALRPYPDRAKIVSGAWPDASEAEVLVWVDDPVDAFFLEIQGSGRVVLAEGGEMRVGYATQNGHPYYAVGRELVKRKIKDKADVSMESIRTWMAQNPREATDLMNTNPSYVFFREMSSAAGPEGAQGVPLTPGRSLAIDRTQIPYGVPIWLEAAPPFPGEAPLRRLMVAQDTGGAIRGGIRGDVFWGHGQKAEQLAGPMKSEGQIWFLLPRGLVPGQSPSP